jgi:Tfp pilus assembly protein PilX
MEMVISRKFHSSKERGFVLVTSYLLLTVLSIFSLTILARSYSFLQATERNKNRILAFNQAESGIDVAISQLAGNAVYPGTDAYTQLGNNSGYTVQVCPPACDGLTQPTDSTIRLVSAVGYTPSNVPTARAYEARTILAYVKIGGAGFDYAAYAKTAMDIVGNPIVDSYSAGAGDYGEDGNVGSSGDVATDGTVDLTGNVTVNGSVYGATINEGNNVTVTGQKSDDTPQLNCSPGSTDLASSGELNVGSNDGVRTLNAGTYHFDSIRVSGQGQIRVTGPVVIYVDGQADFSGQGIVNETNVPSNLIIIATGEESVQVGGNSAFSGGIFAPDSYVHLNGNQDFYGSVIAKTLRQNGNADLHYDTDLSDYELSCNSVKLLSWQEKSTLLS